MQKRVACLPQTILAAVLSVIRMQGKQEKLSPISLPNDTEINSTVESISDMTGPVTSKKKKNNYCMQTSKSTRLLRALRVFQNFGGRVTHSVNY